MYENALPLMACAVSSGMNLCPATMFIHGLEEISVNPAVGSRAFVYLSVYLGSLEANSLEYVWLHI